MPGVEAVHDVGGYGARMTLLNQQVADGALLAPNIYPSYFMLNGQSFAEFQHAVTTEAEVIAAIDELAALGAAQIKIHRALPPALLPVVVKHATAAGLGVTGHIPLGMHPLAACEAGMNTVQHLASFIEAIVSVLPEGENQMDTLTNGPLSV